MIEMNEILDLSERIAREFRPERIILFGSYAYGRPTVDSDVDLLVVMPFEGKGVHQAIEILDRLDARLPVDLLVRTPQELCERLGMNDFFLREVVERGKVLYAAPDA